MESQKEVGLATKYYACIANGWTPCTLKLPCQTSRCLRMQYYVHSPFSPFLHTCAHVPATCAAEQDKQVGRVRARTVLCVLTNSLFNILISSLLLWHWFPTSSHSQMIFLFRFHSICDGDFMEKLLKAHSNDVWQSQCIIQYYFARKAWSRKRILSFWYNLHLFQP